MNSQENLPRFKKVTQTIKNTSLAIEKWRKQYKTPPLLYKSVLDKYKTRRLLDKSDAND